MDRKRSAVGRLAVILPCVLFWIFHPHVTFSFPKSIQDAARDKGVSPEQYLEDVSSKAGAYQESSAIAGREEFMEELKKAMGNKGLHLVIGGKSLGKTKIVKTLADKAGDDAALLYVDMRKPPKPESTNVLECLQAQAKSAWNDKNLPPYVVKLLATLKTIAQTAGKQSFKGNSDDAASGGAELALSELLDIPKPEEFLRAWVAAAVADNELPVIIVDEANIAFPTGNGNGENTAKREAASKALQLLVALTKQDRKVSVILIASDYTFPLGLQNLGFNKFDALKSIVVPEVENETMLAVLGEWGLSQDVAQEFYMNFGGNVFLCHQAIDKLSEQFRMGKENLFDPVRVQSNDGLGDLVGDSLTREHMENLAEKGWSPIKDGTAEGETESQKGARIIAKKNFGAIINQQTTTFLDPDVEAEMFRDTRVVRVLLPPTTYARKCIQKMVEAAKLSQAAASDSGSTGLPNAAATPATPITWVRQLALVDEAGQTYDESLPAFKITVSVTDVDDLKKAIKKEEELKIPASQILIYSRDKDGEWRQEEEDAEVKRGATKSDCYGFVLPDAS